MHLSWGAVVKILMWALMIVKMKVGCEPCIERRDSGITVEINVFIFHRTPQPLNKDVVQSAAFPIHTDADLCGFQDASKGSPNWIRTTV